MTDSSRRNFLSVGLAIASVAGLAPRVVLAQGAGNGFTAASSAVPGSGTGPVTPGIQGITAVCEVTGGGEKVYGIAIEYDTDIETDSLEIDNYATRGVPAAKGYLPGTPTGPDKDATTEPAAPRTPVAVYTNTVSALRPAGS